MRAKLSRPRAPRLTAAAALLALAPLAALAPARAEPGHQFPALSDAERQAIRAAIPARPRARPARPRRVLIFYRTDGYVHASIPYGIEALTQLGTVTGAYTAEASEDLDEFAPSRLAAYDAVIFVSATHLAPSPSQRAALLAFVSGGRGLVGIHAASDSFYTWPEGQALLGGIFNSHPWTAQDSVAVKLDDPGSPLTQAFGGHGFWVRDEIYQIDGPYSRERVHVLMSLDMARPENARQPDQIVRADADFPIAWIRTHGRGRVFYSSLGHNPELYRTREVLQHYLDGIQYALGDLRSDATPSAHLAHPPAPAPAPEWPAPVLNAAPN